MAFSTSPMDVAKQAQDKIAQAEAQATADVRAAATDAAVKAALEELAKNAAYLKILGSYPVAVY